MGDDRTVQTPYPQERFEMIGPNVIRLQLQVDLQGHGGHSQYSITRWDGASLELQEITVRPVDGVERTVQLGLADFLAQCTKARNELSPF